ncbi:MAG: DUF4142 domain-containing protein [Acidobacteriota bacterium]
MKLLRITLPVAAAGFLGFQMLAAQDNPVSSGAHSAAGAAQETGNKAKHKAAKTADQAGDTTGMKTDDHAFLTRAAQASVAEVKLGQLAQERGSSEAVKHYGKQMVEDHSKSDEQLKQIASSKGMTLPDTMSPKDQEVYDRLSKLSGSDFDRAYMNYARKSHKKNIAMYRRVSERGKDADIKTFAQNQLPTMEEHLREAESQTASMGQTNADRTRTDNTNNPMSYPSNPDRTNPSGTTRPNYPNNPNTSKPNR